MMHLIKKGCLLCLILVIFSGCATLEKNPYKEEMFRQPAATSGFLKTQSEKVLKTVKAEESAFKFLFRNAEALRWRLALIDQASASIDLQVFIWQDDETGRLLLDRLLKAANRGVKVRLLIDDIPKGWSDQDMYLIAQEPNMAMRNFNPSRARKGILLPVVETIFNFSELNRRMHNKQMLVDGRWAVLGGRNMGNPYFGLSQPYNFRDIDLLITGPILNELATSFDIYWNSDAAYPAESMVKSVSEKKKKKIVKKFYDVLAEDQALLKQTPFLAGAKDQYAQFESLPETMIPGVGIYMYDKPAVRGDRGKRLYQQLLEFNGAGAKDTLVISPYLIPSKDMISSMAESITEGATVTILTASMDSNNHTMANSHYKKYRKPLLKSGAEIYEFSGQPGPAMRELSDTSPVRADFISLHIKAFVVDYRWVYMGSLNMDPRALVINTEDILAIDSPELAGRLIKEARQMILPENAWAVKLNEKGKVRWHADDEVRKHQPARSFCQRLSDWFFRWMPIESQL